MGERFHLDGYPGDDARERFAKAMDALRRSPGSTLVVPPGEYLITSELARAAQRKVMAGEWGPNPQPTMFHPSYVYDKGVDFRGQRGTRFEATGARFLVDGFMEPFSLVDCEDVTLFGFTIDHQRKPFSHGNVEESTTVNGETQVTVVFRDEHPILPGTPLLIRSCLWRKETGRFDPLKPARAEVLGTHRARFTLPSDGRSFPTGTDWYSWQTVHSRPAVRIENASRITLRDVTIHSQPGMGVVAHRSHDVSVLGLQVVPSPGFHLSTNTDATHFTSCTGTVRLDACAFDGQGDDSLNIHGYYHSLESLGDRRCRIRMEFRDGTHTQTPDRPDPGAAVEIVRRDSLETVARTTVVACETSADGTFSEVTLADDVPGDLSELFFSDVSRMPRLVFTNCAARNHYARGILVKTRNALIENNRFSDLTGMGIEVAAESHWWESATPADVTIRGNRIHRCGSAKKAAIGVFADCDRPRGAPIRGVVIEDNHVDCPETPHGIFARGVDGLRVVGNRIACAAAPIVLEECERVERDD